VPKGEQIFPFHVQSRRDRILAMNVTNLALVPPRPIGWKGLGALAQSRAWRRPCATAIGVVDAASRI